MKDDDVSYNLSKGHLERVSNSAFTQARANLRHTAFIALNDRNMEIYYGDGIYERYKGFRVLAIDSSKVRLEWKSKSDLER